MKSVFVDANVFLRFFTKDDDGQHEQAERLFRAGAEGEVVLISGPPVLFEVAWTLRAAYRQSAGASRGVTTLPARTRRPHPASHGPCSRVATAGAAPTQGMLHRRPTARASLPTPTVL